MADLSAERCQVGTNGHGVGTILGTHESAHVVNDHGMLGGRVLASDTLDVGRRHSALGLGSLNCPGSGVGIDELELSVVLLGLGRSLQSEGSRDVCGIMAHHIARGGIEHHKGGRILRIFHHWLSRGLVHQTRGAGVSQQELLIIELLVHDGLQHRKPQGCIGAGPGSDPVGSLSGRLGIDRIDHHELATVFHHFLETLEVALLGDGGIVAPNNAIGAVLNLVTAVQKALAVNVHNRLVHAGTAKLAYRRSGAAEMRKEGIRHRAVHGPEVARASCVANRLVAIGGNGLIELLLDKVEGLVPGNLLKFTRTLIAVAQKRHRQSIGIVAHKATSDAASTGGAVVQLGRLHLHKLAVHHIALEVVMLALRRARRVEDLRICIGILPRDGQVLVLGRRLVGGRRGASGQAHSSRSRGSAHEGATGELGVNGAFAVLRHRTLLPQIGFSRELRRKDV